MDNRAVCDNKDKNPGRRGTRRKDSANKNARIATNTVKKVRLQEYLDSLIELHKLQGVLLNQMDKEV